MAANSHHYSFLVKEHHLDTFGHVNNAIILQILEEARWEMMTPQGFGLERILALKQGPVLLEVTIKYRKELLLRQEYTIETTPLDYRGKIGRIQQLIKTKDNETAVDAIFTVGLFDLVRRKLIDPTEAWLRAIGAATP